MASGCSDLSRSASSSERGVRTSIGGDCTVSRAVAASLPHRLAVARGDEPADVVIRGGRVLSVFTHEWLEGDVAIVDGVIAGIGTYDGEEIVDAGGRYVVPGFVDAHMHL